MHIRKAAISDLSRVAEILVYNNRLNFFPIFGDESYSFGAMQVVPLVNDYFSKPEVLESLYVYDDGVIRGFIQLDGTELHKLYVDSFFQNRGIGGELVEYATREKGAKWLWALEKNVRAIAFYQRHGFRLTGERTLEEGTTEYLVRMEI